MRRVDEACQALREPVIAPRLPAVAVHALLDDHPPGIVRDDETVQVEIEAVLNGGTVDLGDEAARFCQCAAIETDAIANRYEFARRLAGVLAAAAADMDAQFAGKRGQTAFQCTEDAGGDTGRMPVHAHDGTEGLEPERMRKPPQKLVASVVDERSLG
jgi:hypothetical protein